METFFLSALLLYAGAVTPFDPNMHPSGDEWGLCAIFGASCAQAIDRPIAESPLMQISNPLDADKVVQAERRAAQEWLVHGGTPTWRAPRQLDACWNLVWPTQPK